MLVNNAGIDAPPAAAGGGHRLEDIPFDVNRRIFEVNTLGLFQVTQLFGGDMAKAAAARSSTSARSTHPCRRTHASTTTSSAIPRF